MSKLNKVLKSFTAETIYFCFVLQQKRFAQKKNKKAPASKDERIREYAEQCSKSFHRELRACKTKRDEALLAQNLLKRLKRSSDDFMNAFNTEA